MRRKLIYTAVLMLALFLATGVWAMSGIFLNRDQVYDLNRPEPATPLEKAKRAVAFHVGELVLPLIYDERTSYAASYNEETFQSLTIGMTEEDVRKILGEPLAKRKIGDGRSVLYYSQQATPTDNYLMRNLVFDGQGRLLERRAEFYVD